MKIQLEFEKADLVEMLNEYFGVRGFDIKNMDDIVQQFDKTWPEGLRVSASAVVDEKAPDPPKVASASVLPEEELAAVDTTDNVVSITKSPKKGDGNPRLGMSDL